MALTPDQRRGFPPLCPDLVVELASPTDAGLRVLASLRRKMALYQRHGAQLGWLLLPAERSVEIWPSNGEPQRQPGATHLDGGSLFPCLQLDLAEIWQA